MSPFFVLIVSLLNEAPRLFAPGSEQSVGSALKLFIFF
jgi:hypothetical protein